MAKIQVQITYHIKNLENFNPYLKKEAGGQPVLRWLLSEISGMDVKAAVMKIFQSTFRDTYSKWKKGVSAKKETLRRNQVEIWDWKYRSWNKMLSRWAQ